MIALLFYIKHTRINEIDKVVYGFEFPNDSIFAVGLRVPNYSLIFLWALYAKRNGLEGKIEHFGGHFRWPFVAFFVLSFFIFIFMFLAMSFGENVGIIAR